MVLGRSGDVNRVYLGTDTRVGSVLAGCALACVLALTGSRSSSRSAAEPSGWDERSVGRGERRGVVDVAGLLAVVVIAVLWCRVQGTGQFGLRGGLALHASLVAVVIAVVVCRPMSLPARILAFRPFVLLGAVSYGLYLWHWPVFLYVDQRVDVSPAVATLIKVTVSLALSIASLRIIEQPLRRRGSAVLGGVIPTASVVALLVLGATTLPAAQRGGAASGVLAKAPTSLDDLKERSLPTAGAASSSGHAGPVRVSPPQQGAGDRPRLLPARGGTGAAVVDRPGRTPGALRVMVLGDSVPFLLGEELVAEQASLGLVVANRAVPACSAAAPDGGTPLAAPIDCAGLWTSDAQAFDPDVVIVSLNGDVGLELQYDGTWGDACSSAYADRLTSRVSDRLATVTARGGKAYLLTPLPE